uniref:non-specific serine/threonine protein kinase n=1 Tax=Ananas comosus var. bracteatus TaxID=296719 RepID=A0A6V7P5P8_ANACO|nr:unnamed protein product [Ananas comosus var. bracteatus]
MEDPRRRNLLLLVASFLVLCGVLDRLCCNTCYLGATLLEIKKSFRNADNILYDWSESSISDYCSWRGVICDNVTFNVIALGDLTVNWELKSLISIDLKANSFSGQIPDEIGDCPSLKVIDISYNNIFGDIPFSISKLKQLENLILKNNQLIGPIPSTLSQIPNLKILDLAQNKLSGEIPRLIYWNEVLQYLGLRGNNLEGILSPDMCQLTGLWYFDVKNNSLTGAYLRVLGTVQVFRDLSYNQFSGDIPFNIGFLQVATLSLQGNKFSGPIPSVIGLMQALAVLYLQGNKLTGPIPPELGNMTRLHYLELNDNRLTGSIPPELGKLSDLFDLNVANNYLEGPIPDNLSSCVNLNSLNAHGNKLNGTIPRSFKKLESMTYLNLSSNNLKGPIPIELSRIGNLDTLNLSDNHLAGYIPGSLEIYEVSWRSYAWNVSSEIQCSSDISHNQLSGLIPQELGLLQNLFLLKLESNNLSGDIISLTNCFSLTVLNVSYNNLVGEIPTDNNFSRFSPDSFIGNPGLCGYWLSSSCRSSHPAERVNVTPKLVILHMNMALHVYEDIMRMTENLSEKYIIGYGASSTVYKCMLKNCKPARPREKKLDWDTRLRIALGAAQGLAYLHHDCSPRIIHRDVKSSNILLDKDYEAHLTDFGIAKSLCVSKTHTSTYVMGTIGYIDPNMHAPPGSMRNRMSIAMALELNDNRLTGSIPPELGKLSDLFDLNVANNYLEGPIPDNLSSCVNLNSLNAHGNKLNGTIPRSFKKLESMTYLNLSSNNLKGPIPIELSRIGNLDTLNLSDNHLAGYIPGEFGNLRSIMEIDISHNQLSGLIPQELGLLQNLFLLKLESNNLSGDIISLTNCFSLTVLNVSYNNLVGEIPTDNNFSRFSPDSFIGNPGLCGYWLSSSCRSSHPAERAPISKAAILGIALGGLVILLMILVAVCRPHNPPPFPDGSITKPVNVTPKLVILHMNMALHVYEDIMRMTENLSEKYIIGYGASSTVYKCMLKNCKPVAIKRLYSHYPQSSKEFETELETVGSIKHRNLVSLQGYSLSPSGNLLFYDYMENGSLWDLLHGPTKKKKLDWDTRLRIALGAQGLAYLHHDCSPRIIHRDVKSSNILLDKDYEAHLTDFGIAKSLCVSKTHTSTYVMGTIGYIDPEYARTSRLNEKSDVYSYGVVLLEILTGKKAVDNECNLHHLILSKATNNAVMETVDPDVSSTCKDLGRSRRSFNWPSCAPSGSRLIVPPCTSYIDEYSNLKSPNALTCAASMSSSDAQLFLKFGEKAGWLFCLFWERGQRVTWGVSNVSAVRLLRVMYVAEKRMLGLLAVYCGGPAMIDECVGLRLWPWALARGGAILVILGLVNWRGYEVLNSGDLEISWDAFFEGASAAAAAAAAAGPSGKVGCFGELFGNVG